MLVGAEPSDPRWTVVIGSFRVARAVTAVLVGAGLGVAGLLMQTLLHNALADPYVLGVSAGASLGVALFLGATSASAAAAFGAGLVGLGRLGAVGSAAAGAAAELTVVLALARRARSAVTLVVVGVMVGAVTSAVVSLVLVWTDPRTAQQYVVWSLGSVDGTTAADLPVLAATVGVGMALAGVLATSLNAFLLGGDLRAQHGR